MRNKIALQFSVLLLLGTAIFAEEFRPISNPVFVDSPEVGTSVRPIFMYHSFPDKVNTTLGEVPLGGDLQLYALQFEIQLAENLSLIAVKDGYIDFNPDNTDEGMFSDQEGWADLAAGLKYVFFRDEDARLVASAKVVVEIPIGDDDVWQGNGDGTMSPAVAVAKQSGPWNLQGTLGYIQAFNDEDSSMLYDAWHVSYAIEHKIFPLIELNHFHVTSAGDGGTRFNSQVGGAVPSVAKFEGGDLVNLGASNSGDHPDLVTLAFGARIQITESIYGGLAYEIPLTQDKDGLIKDRITLDMVINF